MLFQMFIGWWLNHPSEKYARQIGFIFPNFRGEKKNNLKFDHLYSLARCSHTVDGRNLVKNGINYQPQLVSRISETSTVCKVPPSTKKRLTSGPFGQFQSFAQVQSATSHALLQASYAANIMCYKYHVLLIYYIYICTDYCRIWILFTLLNLNPIYCKCNETFDVRNTINYSTKGIPCMVYLPTFTIKSDQMKVNIPYMDPRVYR